MTKLADEYADIKARLEEIQSERVTAIAGESVSADVPETKPIDWPTMYGVYQAPDDYMGWRDNLAADIIANYRAQMITAG